MGLITKLFGTRSERELKKIQPLVNKILALEEPYSKISEEELRGKTAQFKQRLAEGETLDDILPEAFAAIREAAWRVLNMKHYPVRDFIVTPAEMIAILEEKKAQERKEKE